MFFAQYLHAVVIESKREDWLSRVWRPTKHIIGHIGTGFYGSNDPTDSVKALKEVVVLRIGFRKKGTQTTKSHLANLH